jgi:hypothetical protein
MLALAKSKNYLINILFLFNKNAVKLWSIVIVFFWALR